MAVFSTAPSPGAPPIGAIVYPGQDWGNATVVEQLSGGYMVTGYAGMVPDDDSSVQYTAQMLAAAPPPTPPPIVAAPPISLPPLPALTPQNIVQPFPNITAAIAPQPVACSTWEQLNGWIAQNPIVAVVLLLAAGWIALPKRR